MKSKPQKLAPVCIRLHISIYVLCQSFTKELLNKYINKVTKKPVRPNALLTIVIKTNVNKYF